MEDSFIIDKLKNPETKNYGFNLMLQNYQERVYWHVRKMVIVHEDADDITQNTFMKAWNNLEKFRGESGLFTWLYRIATNECLNFLKKKNRWKMFSMSNYSDFLEDHLTNSDMISGEEIEMKLQKALLKLPDKQRLVFNLKYFDEMKFEEIAEVTQTSIGALKASYHHAVKKIENILNED
ncbi:RNA polymerase sigma factor [Marinoscillum pacificum]|uniref:RNA polymerase sigma factor n=1 Tax=Marinoscillum pacificum TaxID=392723 RepID=UPI00215782EE|nr:sigma-70 family RNA polymerase sigma factor [Marinoscillum pacificum]